MVSLNPSSNPPLQGSNSFSPCPLVSTGIVDRNHPFAPPYPRTWTIESFCKALHSVRTDSLQCGIISVQHWMCPHGRSPYDCLVLNIVPLVPGCNLPQNVSPSHMSIEVERFKDPTQRSFFDIWGHASNEVTVIGVNNGGTSSYIRHQSHPITSDHCLASISWATDLPNLIDVFDIIQLLSLMFPHYNLFTHGNFWLAHTIYSILQETYYPQHVKSIKANWMLRLCHFLTPRPLLQKSPSSTRTPNGSCSLY